ncbi:MAG TPA: hypothetical protein P5121_25750 [Caldilineaceae bacterium]|nr:hypothetical protein [Caldilineaceae bacterium]
MQQDQTKRATMKQRWNATQLSKGAAVWICLAMVAGTMLVGFTWGGWVTESTAQRSATTMANDAVVQRLSAICVAQFQQDPAKADKLVELKAASSYQQGSYVKDQGWSIMPGDEQSDTKVATACAKVLAQME